MPIGDKCMLIPLDGAEVLKSEPETESVKQESMNMAESVKPEDQKASSAEATPLTVRPKDSPVVIAPNVSVQAGKGNDMSEIMMQLGKFSVAVQFLAGKHLQIKAKCQIKM